VPQVPLHDQLVGARDQRQSVGVVELLRDLGSGGQCSPRHSKHFGPSSLEVGTGYWEQGTWYSGYLELGPG